MRNTYREALRFLRIIHYLNAQLVSIRKIRQNNYKFLFSKVFGTPTLILKSLCDRRVFYLKTNQAMIWILNSGNKFVFIFINVFIPFIGSSSVQFIYRRFLPSLLGF